MTDRAKTRLIRVGAALLLVAAALALYLPTLDFFHLRLDDALYTLACPFVKGGLTLENVFAAFSDPGHGGIWMPLTYVTYMADVSLFGGDWAGFHFTNVVLHVLNALLLFALLTRLLPRFGCEGERRVRLAAALATLVWLLHPMRAEAVAWVAARKEELWTLFALLSLLAWLKVVARASSPARPPSGILRVPYLLAFAAFLLAGLSKPTALCLPALLYAVERLAAPRRRLRLIAYAPFALVAVALGLLTVYSQSHPTDSRAIDIFDTSLGWRLLNAAVASGLYVWHSFVPAGIHFDYRAVFGGRPLDCALGLAVLAATLAAVAALLVWAKRRPALRRAALLALAWFAIPLAPALGVFGIVGDHALADRYAYAAAGGLAFLLAWALARLRPPRAALLAGGLVAAAALTMTLAVSRPVVASFRDDLAAFSRALAFDPDHWRALHFVGAEYCARQGRSDEGLRMIRRSLALSPRPSTAATLAYLLAYRGRAGDFAEVRRLGAAVARDPRLDREGMMLDALGVAALRDGDDRAAVAYLTAALNAPRRQHTKTHAMLNLAIALANVGCDREALRILAELRRVRDKAVRERAIHLSLAVSQAKNRPRIPFSNQ